MVRLDSFNEFSCKQHLVRCLLLPLFYCNIRRIRKYLSKQSTETLIHAFVSSRVDYCNSLLYGLPAYQLNKLQRVQNATAKLIFQES